MIALSFIFKKENYSETNKKYPRKVLGKIKSSKNKKQCFEKRIGSRTIKNISKNIIQI